MNETCGRSGRRLKNPIFREIGYGKTCAAKLGITVPTKRKPKAPPADCDTATSDREMEGR